MMDDNKSFLRTMTIVEEFPTDEQSKVFPVFIAETTVHAEMVELYNWINVNSHEVVFTGADLDRFKDSDNLLHLEIRFNDTDVVDKFRKEWMATHLQKDLTDLST